MNQLILIFVKAWIFNKDSGFPACFVFPWVSMAWLNQLVAWHYYLMFYLDLTPDSKRTFSITVITTQLLFSTSIDWCIRKNDFFLSKFLNNHCEKKSHLVVFDWRSLNLADPDYNRWSWATIISTRNIINPKSSLVCSTNPSLGWWFCYDYV